MKAPVSMTMPDKKNTIYLENCLLVIDVWIWFLKILSFKLEKKVKLVKNTIFGSLGQI